jgi:hypothetical protein
LNFENIEFWFVVAGGIAAGISWIIKTYSTFAKHVDVENHLAELRSEFDNRFSAVQERTNKALDELKDEIKAQGKSDVARVKEVHARVDGIIADNQKLILQVGELKGRVK